IVVRPDRPVMVRHWIVERLAAGHRADAPSRIEICPEQCGSHRRTALDTRDPCRECMTGVGGPHPARALVAIECKSVKADVFAPECRFDPLPRLFGGLGQCVGALW